MKKLFTPFAYALCCTALTSTSLAGDNFIHLGNAADFQALINNDKVVALFVYPPGQPCKNILAAATKVAAEGATTKFVVVDIRTFPGLRSQYHVGGIPTIILFRNGVELARSTGQRDVNSLRMFIAKTFLGTAKTFMTSPIACAAAWIKGHFTTNPICEEQ